MQHVVLAALLVIEDELQRDASLHDLFNLAYVARLLLVLNHVLSTVLNVLNAVDDKATRLFTQMLPIPKYYVTFDCIY